MLAWTKPIKKSSKTGLFLLVGKFEDALSLDYCELLYKAVYIDSALLGLVGTASMSDYPVVYDFTIKPKR